MLKNLLVAGVLLATVSSANAYGYKICALPTSTNPMLCLTTTIQAANATAAYLAFKNTAFRTLPTDIVVTSTKRGCSTHSIRRTDLAVPNAYGWDKRFRTMTHPSGCTP